jgi:hypothetical protein
MRRGCQVIGAAALYKLSGCQLGADSLAGIWGKLCALRSAAKQLNFADRMIA